MEDIRMNKQRLIMENWRRFLKESQQLNRDDMRLLYVDKSDGDGKAFNIVLYVEDINSGGDNPFKIIGGIDCMETEEPCIPKTMMVGSVYRNSEFAGQRLGDLLYDCGFYVAQSLGFGLTSDKETGTKPGASKHWKRFETNPEYAKKATAAGNNEFDYDGSTQDPDDDCNMPDDAPSNATDHSFLKKNPDDIEPVFIKMEQNHLDYLDDLKFNQGYTDDQITELIEAIKLESAYLFADEYDNA